MKKILFTVLAGSLCLFNTACKDEKEPDNGTTHCNDGIQNEDETCVDCGGSCNSCNSSAIQFDGVDDYATVPNILSGMEEGTIEMWLNITAWGTSNHGCYILTGNDGNINTNSSQLMALGIHPDGNTQNELLFGIYTGSGTSWRWAHSNTELTKGKYHHIACTWGPNGTQIIIDGIVAGETNYDGGMPEFENTFLGASAREKTFAGAIIDEFKIWDKVLTTTEIQDFMHCPTAASNANLVGYWNFEENNGNGTSDQSKFGNSIGLMGTDWSNNTPF